MKIIIEVDETQGNREKLLEALNVDDDEEITLRQLAVEYAQVTLRMESQFDGIGLSYKVK